MSKNSEGSFSWTMFYSNFDTKQKTAFPSDYETLEEVSLLSIQWTQRFFLEYSFDKFFFAAQSFLINF